MKNRNVLIVAIAIALLAVGAYAQTGADSTAEVEKYKNLGYVVVTPQGPKDGGDFGPLTPGTQTAGIQEALDFAQKSRSKTWVKVWSAKNVYIARGVYRTQKTITVPWMGECWVLEGRGSIIAYGGKTGDVLVIDSQMNGQIKLGYILGTSLTDGIVVHLRPTIAFSQAPRGVITCSRIEMYAIVGGGDVVSRKTRAPKGIGLYVDSSSGPVVQNAIFINEINACGTSLYLHNPKEGGGIIANTFEVIMNHLANTALQLGDPGCVGIYDNALSMNMEGYVGAKIHAQNNIINFRGVSTETGQDVTFEADSRDNTIYTTGPIKGVTNNALVPTNRIVTNHSIGYSVETPPVPTSGQDVVNRTPYTVEISILRPGSVSGWVETDAKGTPLEFTGGLTTGHRFTLDPGDKIKLSYTRAPEWKWKAMR